MRSAVYGYDRKPTTYLFREYIRLVYFWCQPGERTFHSSSPSFRLLVKDSRTNCTEFSIAAQTSTCSVYASTGRWAKNH